MGVLNIFENQGNELIPTPAWNKLLNRIRRQAPRDTGRMLGNYVASMALHELEDPNLVSFYGTMRNFVEAAEPPLTGAEEPGFHGAFMILAPIIDASDLARDDMRRERLTS